MIRVCSTHHIRDAVAGLTYAQLEERTTDHPVPLVEEILDEFYGKSSSTLSSRVIGSGEQLIKLLRKNTYRKPLIGIISLFPSLKGAELLRIRRLAKRANLAMLHNQNPFIFIAYHRFIKLTAVGFHRLYLNRFALENRQAGGHFHLCLYCRLTQHCPSRRTTSEGVVTDYPDKFVTTIERSAE